MIETPLGTGRESGLRPAGFVERNRDLLQSATPSSAGRNGRTGSFTGTSAGKSFACVLFAFLCKLLVLGNPVPWRLLAFCTLSSSGSKLPQDAAPPHER
jgi:hypothetical protein